MGESAREVTDPASCVVNGERVGGSHPCANPSLEPGRVLPEHTLPASTVANPSLEPGRVLPEPTLPALTVASPSGPHAIERKPARDIPRFKPGRRASWKRRQTLRINNNDDNTEYDADNESVTHNDGDIGTDLNMSEMQRSAISSAS